MSLKNLEVLLNIASYAILAMISVLITKIGIKVYKSKKRN